MEVAETDLTHLFPNQNSGHQQREQRGALRVIKEMISLRSVGGAGGLGTFHLTQLQASSTFPGSCLPSWEQRGGIAKRAGSAIHLSPHSVTFTKRTTCGANALRSPVLNTVPVLRKSSAERSQRGQPDIQVRSMLGGQRGIVCGLWPGREKQHG